MQTADRGCVTPGCRGAVLLCLMLTLSSGCSSYQLAYNHMDRLLFVWVDDYVDLSAAQHAVLEPQVQQWHAQHRRTELPLYKDLLIAARAALQSPPLAAGLAETWQQDAEARWLALRSSLAPLAITLLEQLDLSQQQVLLVTLRSKVDSQRQDYLERSPAQQAEYLAALYRQRMQRWIGRLTSDQDRDLKRLVQVLADTQGQRFGYRRRWIDALEQALIIRSDKPQFDALIETLMVTPQDLLTETQRASMAVSQRQRHTYLRTLVNGLSAPQRQQLLAELEALIAAAEQLLQEQD